MVSYDKSQKLKKACNFLQAFRIMVLGRGIEPRTRGFSILFLVIPILLNDIVNILFIFLKKLRVSVVFMSF